MGAHTPGPWEAIASNCSNLIHVETSDTHTTVCSLPKKRTADAHLIAAAPDLLAVCKKWQAVWLSEGTYDSEIDAAIAKAEGR